MKIEMKANFAAVARALQGLERNLPFAVREAVNGTALAVQAGLKQEMARVFDRPTPYTLRAIRFDKATKANLTATVYVVNDARDSKERREKYLAPEVFGGLRRRKAFELALQGRGVLKPNQFVVPPEGGSFMSRIDPYGNISPGQIKQVMSWFGAAETSDGNSVTGFTANMTPESRKRFKKREGAFFISQGPGSYYTIQRRDGTFDQVRQHLPAGVWMGTRGKDLNLFGPVMLFVKQPHYTPRFDFFGVGRRIAAQEGPGQLQAGLVKAIRTARELQP